MRKPRSRKMTENVKSAEPDPLQLHLSDESEEKEEEVDEEEDEDTVEGEKAIFTNEFTIATKSGEQYIPNACGSTKLVR